MRRKLQPRGTVISRRLKVYSKHVLRATQQERRYVYLPEIRLQGQWLEACGFEVGTPIEVSHRRDEIVIRVCAPEYK